MFVGHLPDTHVLCLQKPRLMPRSLPALEVVSKPGSEHQGQDESLPLACGPGFLRGH